MEDTFQMLNDDDKMLDSMAYDSGELICSFGNDNDYVQIAIRGDVRVIYKDEIYKHFTNMPEELQQLFIKGNYQKIEQIAYIAENNWPEFEYYKDGQYIGGDVFEVGTPVSKEVLENECKLLLEYCRNEEK